MRLIKIRWINFSSSNSEFFEKFSQFHKSNASSTSCRFSFFCNARPNKNNFQFFTIKFSQSSSWQPLVKRYWGRAWNKFGDDNAQCNKQSPDSRKKYVVSEFCRRAVFCIPLQPGQHQKLLQLHNQNLMLLIIPTRIL